MACGEERGQTLTAVLQNKPHERCLCRPNWELGIVSSEEPVSHDQQLDDVFLSPDLCCFTAKLLGRSAAYASSAPGEKLHQRLLSTWLILQYRWRCETFHKLWCCVPLELAACLHSPHPFLPPPWLFSLREISRSQSNQTTSTHLPEPPRLEVMVTVMGMLGCKSADSDLIKRAWPVERGS